jgi:hypothetical protein
VFGKLKEPKYSQFWRQLKTSLATLGKKVGDNKAKDFAQYYVTEGYVLRVGNEGSPKATYQFNDKMESSSTDNGVTSLIVPIHRHLN